MEVRILTSKQIRETITGIQARRQEIANKKHPSVFRQEYIRLLRAELDLETELERRKNAAEVAAFYRTSWEGGEQS